MGIHLTKQQVMGTWLVYCDVIEISMGFVRYQVRYVRRMVHVLMKRGLQPLSTVQSKSKHDKSFLTYQQRSRIVRVAATMPLVGKRQILLQEHPFKTRMSSSRLSRADEILVTFEL